ncbi:MAG: efflux RND transporter periplasmic adaptor subunit [Burkholderiales bacterium]|nr:efflux RND transporter periplasmic adaptor subunit [Phycisphaerae bacterium]
MTQISLPIRKSVRSVPTWVYAAALLLTVAMVTAIAVYASRGFGGGSSGSGGFKTVPVKQGVFESRVTVKGDLQAVDNIDINCDVEGSTTITQIVPEGSVVKKGDTLVTLDSSQIRQKLDDALIELQRTTAEVTTAQEMLEIQKSQNAANTEAAEVGLQLAQIDFTKYNEGEYPSLLADAKMAVDKAVTGLKTKQDDLAQTRSLFAKGFVTATEVKNKELDVAAAQRDLTKATTDMGVLEKYTHQADMASKKNGLAQAEQKLERTKRENAANLSQKDADLQSKKQQLDLITRRVARSKEQLAACVIKAPADGMVVYQNQNQNRDNVAVAEGAQVREHQTLMRLPDASRMKVVFKINESQINGMKVGLPATVKLNGDPKPLRGEITKISPVPDSTDRWMNPDRKDYPVDCVLETTPPGLRPGMSVEVSILIDRQDDAISIPVAALYTAGSERYAFVPTDDGARPVKIPQIGRSNDQDVHIPEGLEVGQQVILLEAGQGRVLLERAGIKIADAPAAGPAGEGRKRQRNGAGGAPGGPQSAPPGGNPPGNAPTSTPPAVAVPPAK